MSFQTFFFVTMLTIGSLGSAAYGQVASPFGPEQAEFDQNMKDVLFDFDTHETVVNEGVLQSNAHWLKDHPDVHFYINGYTDDRGDVVYNLVLAQKRAETVKSELINLGIPAERMTLTVGWGELYPSCTEQTESCWEPNRRVHFVYIPAH